MTDERADAVARRMALMARMKNIAKEAWGNDPIRRVHLVVAIDRFLVRLPETTDRIEAKRVIGLERDPQSGGSSWVAMPGSSSAAA